MLQELAECEQCSSAAPLAIRWSCGWAGGGPGAAPAAQLQSRDTGGEQCSLVSPSLGFSTIKDASGISFTKPQALSSDQLVAHCPV